MIHADEQEEAWLTQQSPSANELHAVTGSRAAQAGNSQSADTAEGAHRAQPACKAAVNDADEWPEASDHQSHLKRFRRSQSDHVLAKPKLVDSHAHSQAILACTAAAVNHTKPYQHQQRSRPGSGSPQAAVHGDRGVAGLVGHTVAVHRSNRDAGPTGHRDAVNRGHQDAGPASRGVQRRPPRVQSLLMRLIDDFLFITPSRTAAEALVNKLLKGGLLLHQICGCANKNVLGFYGTS